MDKDGSVLYWSGEMNLAGRELFGIDVSTHTKKRQEFTGASPSITILAEAVGELRPSIHLILHGPLLLTFPFFISYFCNLIIITY